MGAQQKVGLQLTAHYNIMFIGVLDPNGVQYVYLDPENM